MEKFHVGKALKRKITWSKSVGKLYRSVWSYGKRGCPPLLYGCVIVAGEIGLLSKIFYSLKFMELVWVIIKKKKNVFRGFIPKPLIVLKV